MKILIDFTEFGGPNHSLEVYGLRLLAAIPIYKHKDITLLIPELGEDRMRKLFPDFSLLIYNKQPGFQLRHPLSVILFPYRQYRYRRIVNRFDYLLIMSHSNAVTSCFTHCRKVTVVHDLTYTHIPYKPFEFLRSRFWGKYFLRRHLITSDAIISISGYTKKHIAIEFPDIPQDKISVVYNSIVLPNEEKFPSQLAGIGEYILYVNTLKEYKNVYTLLKAFNLISKNIDHKLIIVGRETDYWKYDMISYH